MHTIDSNFVAEEMELYDEIRSTMDEDELLIIMSRLQEHFLEKLEFHNQQRQLREIELQRFNSIEASDTDYTEFTELTETDAYLTNFTDTDTESLQTSPQSVPSTSTKNVNTNNFAYPDDASTPFHLPPRDRDKNGSIRISKPSKSKSSKFVATFFKDPQVQKSLTAANLVQHNATHHKASSLIKTTAALGSSTARPLTPSNKMKYITKSKRGFSMQDQTRNKLKLRQSKSTPNSPNTTERPRAVTHGAALSGTHLKSPHTGTYRLDLFCDIKFVKKIFLRWISCKNEILCHVASRTLGILFSHSYLTPDQFLDLAELLLGVHEDNNLVFGNVEVTYRESRPGIFYGDCSDSSSTPINSDYDSEDSAEPKERSSSDSDLIEIEKTPTETNNSTKNNENIDRNHKVNKFKAPVINLSGLNAIKEESMVTGQKLENDAGNGINENDKEFRARKLDAEHRRLSVASSVSSDPSRRSRASTLAYDVHWDNRFYCAMKVLSYIVCNTAVYEGCVVALDEWFSIIVIDLFRRSRRSGIGVLEGFLFLIKSILSRFAANKDIMGQCKLSEVICSDANDELLDIITSRTSTLVTRASALELCPLLMVTSQIGAKKFARYCLESVLDDGRFNPFEPGDITMSRTFQRGEHGQLRSINEKNPLEKSSTVANYLPSLLFQRNNDVFIDQESVQRLTFLCVIKAMNVLSQQIIAIEEKEERETEREKEREKKEKEQQETEKKKKKKSHRDIYEDDLQGTVDQLEGEFDSSTARKIRNFFSRDAEFTRYRILDLVGEEDDVLIQLLLELLLIESALRKSKSRLAVRVRYLFDPFMLFCDFIDLFDADYLFLMDFLIDGEIVFLEYLLRFCKRLSANWNPNNATQKQINRVMSILIRLRMHIEDLYQKRQFPYSPKALLRAMGRLEFCYESEAAKKHTPNMFDLDYMNYVKKKAIQKQEKEAQEKLKKVEKKAKKPKRLVVASLFLQDVKQQEVMKKRNSQILKKTEINLKKRQRKKKKKKEMVAVKTRKKSVVKDQMTKPMLRRNDSLALHILQSNRKKNESRSKKKKHNIKDKADVRKLNKILVTKRHKAVDAEKKVRIGF